MVPCVLQGGLHLTQNRIGLYWGIMLLCGYTSLASWQIAKVRRLFLRFSADPIEGGSRCGDFGTWSLPVCVGRSDGWSTERAQTVSHPAKSSPLLSLESRH